MTIGHDALDLTVQGPSPPRIPDLDSPPPQATSGGGH